MSREPEIARQRRSSARVFIREFWLFGIRQARACLFGGLLLFFILLTHFWNPVPALHRYDLLFLLAVGIQAVLLGLRLESWREAGVILIFHVVATVMEIFKTSPGIGSWHYPEPAVIRIGNVPLFAGFMYSAVGSYIARVWRIFDFEFSHYPPRWTTAVLAVLIYVNFFTHHFVADIRWALVAASLVLFGRCRIYFRPDRVHRWMPLVVGLMLVALFIWFAENLATWSRIWLYPSQKDGWKMVPLSKLVAWYLLMMISFVLVSGVHRPRVRDPAPSSA